MKKFAVALSVIIVSGESAQARISGMSSISHAHFPTCFDGLVQRICVCRRAGDSLGHISSVDLDRIATPSTACAGNS